MMGGFGAYAGGAADGGKLPRLLLVEDDLSQARLIELIFKRSEFPAELHLAHSLADARKLLGTMTFDLVITDFNLPDGWGMELLPTDPSTRIHPVMLLTGQGDEKVAVEAMKMGALEYIVKTDESIRALPGTVTRVLREWGNVLLRREMEEALRQKQLELEEKHRQLQQVFQLVCQGKREWELTIDCVSDLIIRTDNHGKIRRANRAVAELTGRGFNDLVGKDLAEVLGDLQVGESGQGQVEMHHLASGRWFMINSYRFEQAEIGSGSVITGHDYTTIRELNLRLEDSNRMLAAKSHELESAYDELKRTQAKALHQEKMATIGQLAAGVAHEINNPMGFIQSNLGTLEKYLARVTDYLAAQEALLARVASPEQLAELGERRRAAKVDVILGDIGDILRESLDGAGRVRKIVSDLKGFTHQDVGGEEEVELNQLLESTVPIVWNEIKYKATLHRDYSELPAVFCQPRLISQVFANLLVNAVQAIEKQGEITVRTWREESFVCLSVADTGQGIPENVLKRIFDPFFTTKEVGVGTGLGLSISYDIIKQHGGELLVESTPGAGSTFTIRLPLGAGRSPAAPADGRATVPAAAGSC